MKNADKIAKTITDNYLEYHNPENLTYNVRWNALYGQWLVYGFERYIGFSKAASLCAVIETAHKKKRSVYDAAHKFFSDLK